MLADLHFKKACYFKGVADTAGFVRGVAFHPKIVVVTAFCA